MSSNFFNSTENVTLGIYDTTAIGGGLLPKPGIISAETGEIPLGKEGHYGYPDLHGNPDVGGEFLVRKGTFQTNIVPLPETICGYGAYATHKYTGVIAGPYAAPVAPSSILDGSAYGASAYSKMKPTQPIFNGLNAIYELRELPEMLHQKFLKSGLKGISNYWIALQFGWEPLLNDIRKTVQFQRKAQSRLRQLLRDNGKPVRRTFEIASTSSDPVTTSGSFGSIQPGFVTNFYKNFGEPKVQTISQSSSRIWAAARFRYWLPDGPRDIVWRRKMLASLYGLNPTPSVVYNAIPWSWLVDWFSNVGDVVNNLDSGVADRLAADYFYVMRQEDTIKSQTCTMTLKGVSGKEYPLAVSSTWKTTTKSRLKGDPFGFHTSSSSLSAMQLSILGALGHSKL